MLKPWCWSHSAGVGIRFSLKSLPAHCNLGFSVGHWHPLNSPSLRVYPGTSSESSANPQGLYPTLDTPGSPISSWTTLQKKIQPLPQAFEMMTPGWWGREAARIRLPDIIWIWSRTIRHLLSLPVQFHGSCCPNPQMHKREHELFGSFASNIVLWSVWKGLMKSDSEITDKCQPHLFIVSSKWERQWRRRVNLLWKIHCPNLPATCRLSEMLTQVWQGCLIYEQLKGGGKKGGRIKHYKSMSNIHNPEVLVVNNTKH